MRCGQKDAKPLKTCRPTHGLSTMESMPNFEEWCDCKIQHAPGLGCLDVNDGLDTGYEGATYDGNRLMIEDSSQ